MVEARPDTILDNTRSSDGSVRSYIHLAPHYCCAKQLCEWRKRSIYWVCPIALRNCNSADLSQLDRGNHIIHRAMPPLRLPQHDMVVPP